MWHNTGNAAGIFPSGGAIQAYEHVENPDTNRRLKNLLDVSGMSDELHPIQPREATEEELLRVHTRPYLNRLATLSAADGGDAGFTPFAKDGYEIARLAAGGVVKAVDAVLDGTVDNAYALVRPPGHHALAELGMGFCLLCNTAIAGQHALQARGLNRIASVDWDVHHGNGTQAAFWESPAALTISVHQSRCFPPDSGELNERGAGAGKGYKYQPAVATRIRCRSL